jgi:hypothetical protein
MNVPFDQEIIIENERALLQPIQRLADAEPLWPINKANPMLMQYSPAMI